MLVSCALALRHVDVCANDLDQLAEGRKFMMGVCFQVFDCSIRQQDSELLKEISLLAQCLLDFFPQPFSIVWVNAFPHIVSAWKALQRIKPPDPVTLVRPIQKTPRRAVQNPGTGAA